ncbi:hypothetical protein LTR17_026017 [Elasticomyces elasticus]|nr:hypothetical protein LTR17_026017 [Elasticomyces elasticus]
MASMQSRTNQGYLAAIQQYPQRCQILRGQKTTEQQVTKNAETYICDGLSVNTDPGAMQTKSPGV